MQGDKICGLACLLLTGDAPASRYLCYGAAPARVQIMKDLAGGAPAGLLAGAYLAGVIMRLQDATEQIFSAEGIFFADFALFCAFLPLLIG